MTEERGSQLSDLDAITCYVHEHAFRIAALAQASQGLLDNFMPPIGELFDAGYAENVARAGTLLRIMGESASALSKQATALERVEFAVRDLQVQS